MTTVRSYVYAASLLLAALLNAFAGPGALDASYVPGVVGPVYAEALQADGRLVIGGSFTSVGGVSRTRIARLWPNGALDTSFQNSMSGASGNVNCLAVQSDGRIVIGGTFSGTFGGGSRYGVARLNANGALDGSFIPANYTAVSALAVQSDNKVIIAGSGPYYVYRLNADGSMENAFTNFSTGPNGPIYAVALQPDGKIIIGGSFTSFNGTARNNIARLDADGWLDYSFLNGLTGPAGVVRCVQVQPDGKILIGGDFSSVNGTTRSRVARLTSSGAVDPGFVNPAVSGQVYALQLQPDSRVTIGGSFSVSTYVSPYTYYSYHVARLNADGTMDASFLCTNSSYFNRTYALAAQVDGAVVCGGDFTYLSSYRYLARVYGSLYPPEFALQPTNRSVTVGTNVTLTALVSNPTPTSFQWHKNGSDIWGATGMSYTLYNVQMGDSGSYSVSAYNAAGSTTSSNAVLNVGITPGITAQPVSVLVPMGGATNISVTATGAPLSYVWIKNGQVLPGATSSVLSFSNFVSTNTGTYYVIVSNFLKSVTSLNAYANMTAPLPAIITQPQSQTVAAGNPASFSVVATNATGYTWRKGGANVASGSVYTIPSVTTNHAGNYTVVASSSSGAVTSSVAVLTVIAPPFFTVQPRSANTNIGANVTFSATVAGTAPIGLQWRKDGVDIPYATLNTYTLANVQLGDSGVYSVYANNAAGGITSGNAVLNVGTRPTITAWTGSLTVTQGQSASFTVSASGIPLAYIWRKGGTVISGATGATYSIPSTVGGDTGSYSVTVSNALGTAIANATLTVLVPVSITEQPGSRTVGEGSNTTFTVTALGTSPVYQWYRNSAPITNATDASYAINNVQFSDMADYTVVVSNILNSVTSQVATLTVQQYPPEITVQPTSLNVAVTKDALFTVGATGTTLTYQWLKEGTNILDATAAELLLTNVSFADAAGYSVIIANPLASVTSLVATLTVGYPPAIVTQPTNQAVPVGSNAVFFVEASGTAPLSYQWLKDETALQGQTNSNLLLNGVTANDAGAFAVLVSSPFGAVTSLVATLTVQFPPEITQQPAGGIRPAGSNITFSVTVTGTEPLVYQWQKDGLDLAGGTAAGYSRSGLTVADSGSYTVVVTNFLGSVTSIVATLTVGNPPVVVEPPQSSTNLLCRTVVLSCTVTGTLPMNLQWLFNGTPLPGETNATLTLMNLQATNAGSYALNAISAFGDTVSPSAQVSVFGTGGAAAWKNTGQLNTGREEHTATFLPNGKVLVVGGWAGSGGLASAELYDPATGIWTTTGALNTGRYNHSATMLQNGKVLVAGGFGSSDLYSAELYDPAAGTWTVTGARHDATGGHKATLLPNGLVLVTGGYRASSGFVSTVEVYDPATGLWTMTNSLAAARANHSATLLPSGKVLVAGGNSSSALSSAELFDLATGTWVMTGTMNIARASHGAELLANGKVLVAAGQGSSFLTSAELYDPVNGTWTLTGTLSYARDGHTTTLLPSGQVLVAGGYYYDGSNWIYPPAAEIYDPAGGSWAITATLNNPRVRHTATLLPSGQVLIASGYNSGFPPGAELYDSGQPTVTVTLGNLAQTYDGTAKSVSVTTTPPGLAVDVTYNGLANPPTNAGSYTVIGTLNDACYQGGATNTLVIYPAASTLTGATILADGAFQFTFVNSPGALFSVLATTNMALPLSNWTVLDGITEVSPGQFQFIDPQATNSPQRFYRVRSP